MSDDKSDFSKFAWTERPENCFTLKSSVNETYGVLRVAEDGRLEFVGDVHESARVFFEHVIAQHSAEVVRLRALVEDLENQILEMGERD